MDQNSDKTILQKGGFNTPLGNTMAFDQAGTAGPGSNREVQRSGSQGTQGPINPGLPVQRPRTNDVMNPGRGR